MSTKLNGYRRDALSMIELRKGLGYAVLHGSNIAVDEPAEEPQARLGVSRSSL
jgi:hypothetical protein